MVASWLPTWPSTWQDFVANYKDIVPRAWPKRLFSPTSESHKDHQALGESIAYPRQLLEWILRTIYPFKDDEGLWLPRWETAFGIKPAGTIAERKTRLIAEMRNRGTFTKALMYAIFSRVWNTDDASAITLTYPTITDIRETCGIAWNDISPSPEPVDRYGNAMAYDRHRNRAILYGGYGSAGYPTDTWEYDFATSTWSQLSPATNPGQRAYHRMEYSPALDKIILFGGFVPPFSTSDQTWEFDCKTNEWTQLSPATKPSARYSHSMWYDDTNNVILLFGGTGAGWNQNNSYMWLGTTW
ncbi:MAG: Kelch repeat-containing protein, partial [Planctomycetota bacterium]